MVGGPCTYDKYPGKSKITKVEKSAASKQQAKIRGSAPYEGYEIRFTFTPDKPITDKLVADRIANPQLF